MTRCHLSLCAAALAAAALAAVPSTADVGVFVAAVQFGEKANLEAAPGFGLRWGRSRGLLGGETSLMIARPERRVSTSRFSASESGSVIFYEGRFLLNLPAGRVRPFLSAGYGAITILPGDLEDPLAGEEDLRTLAALSQIETSQALSYGGGARWSLNDRLDARLDLRQYQVFSVTGAVVEQLAAEAAEGLVRRQGRIPGTELSAGVLLRF